MLNRPEFARDMKSGEEPLIDALLADAFGGRDEVTLVHKLRRAGLVAGEQVLPMGDRIVGYYALSYLAAPKGWLALAPVAIAPDLQRMGHGKRMIGMLTEWARLTQTPVLVLGQQEFYTKAGFSQQACAKLTSPYDIAHHGLAGIGDNVPDVKVTYPPAFGGV